MNRDEALATLMVLIGTILAIHTELPLPDIVISVIAAILFSCGVGVLIIVNIFEQRKQ